MTSKTDYKESGWLRNEHGTESAGVYCIVGRRRRSALPAATVTSLWRNRGGKDAVGHVVEFGISPKNRMLKAELPTDWCASSCSIRVPDKTGQISSVVL